MSSVPATSTKARNSASLGALEAEVQGRRGYIGVRFFIHSFTHALTRSSVHSACHRTISGPAGPSLHVRHAPRPCLLLHVAGVTLQQLSPPPPGPFAGIFFDKIALWVQCGGRETTYLSEKRIKTESGAAA